MPFQISPPILKQFPLTELDGEGGGATIISVIQAATGEESQRSNLFAEFRREYKVDGTVVVQQHLSFDDITFEEVFLTLTDCNIQDSDGKQLFTFQNGKLKDRASFKKAWAKLPPFVAKIIHSKVLEMNPQWSEAGEPSDAGEGA